MRNCAGTAGLRMGSPVTVTVFGQKTKPDTPEGGKAKDHANQQELVRKVVGGGWRGGVCPGVAATV